MSAVTAPTATPTASLGRRLASWSAITLVGTAVTTVAGFLVAPLLARLLPPAELGAWFLAASVVLVAASVGRLGLAQGGVRLVTEPLAQGDPAAARAATRTVGRLALAGAAVVAVVLASPLGRWLADVVFSSPPLMAVMGLVGCWAAAEVVRTVTAEQLRAFGAVTAATATSQAGRALVLVVLLGGLLIAGVDGSLQAVVLASVAAAALPLLVAIPVLRGRAHRLGPPSTLARRAALAVGLPIMVWELTSLVLTQGDVWVVGATLGPADVARYGAASRMALLLGVPLTVTTLAVGPMIAEARAAGTAQLERLLRSSATLAAVPIAAGFVVIALGAGPLLGLFFGPYYRAAAPLLVILAAGQLVNGLTGPCGLALVLTGNQRPVVLLALATTVVVVGAGVAAALWVGAVGVALVAALGLSAYNVSLAVLARRLLGVRTWAMVSPKAVASAVHGLRQPH